MRSAFRTVGRILRAALKLVAIVAVAAIAIGGVAAVVQARLNTGSGIVTNLPAPEPLRKYPTVTVTTDSGDRISVSGPVRAIEISRSFP